MGLEYGEYDGSPGVFKGTTKRIQNCLRKKNIINANGNRRIIEVNFKDVFNSYIELMRNNRGLFDKVNPHHKGGHTGHRDFVSMSTRIAYSQVEYWLLELGAPAFYCTYLFLKMPNQSNPLFGWRPSKSVSQTEYVRLLQDLSQYSETGIVAALRARIGR